MNGTGSIWYQLGIDNSQLQRDADKSSKIFRGIGDTVDSEGARIDNIVKRLTSGIAAMGISLSAGAFLKQIVAVRSEFQNTEAMFKVFLGSAEKASSFMKEMQKYAFNNVFEFKDLTQQAAQLLAYGTEVENVISVIDKLSNVAAGVNQPLERFVELYNKAKSKGKLDSVDVQQWSAMGDVVKYLSEMLGKSTDEVRNLISTGKIGFKEIDQLLTNLTLDGGKFAGMMEEKMKTLGDSVGLLQDTITSVLNELGEKSQDYLRGGILLANDLIENYEKIGRILLELSAIYGTYKAAVVALSVAENLRYQATLAHMAGMTKMQAIMDVLRTKTEALNIAMAKNPYVAVGIAVAALGYSIYKLVTHQTDAEKAQSRLNDAMKEAEKASLGETRELARLKGELSAATKGTDEYNTIKEKIIKNYGKYYDGLEKEIETVGLLESTYNKLTQAIQRSFGARQYEAFIKSEQENLDSVMSDNLGKIQERLYKDLGDEVGANIYSQIRKSLIDGTSLSSEVISILDKVQDKGTILADSRIDGYIRKIQNQQKVTEKVIKDAQVKFGIDDLKVDADSNEDTETKKIKTLTEQTDEARKAVAKLKQELADLRSGKAESSNYAKDIEDKAKELKTAEDKLSYILTGKASSSSSKSTSDVDKKKKEAQDKADLAQKIKNNEARAALDARSIELDNQQKMLDILDDGFEKQQKQIDLNHKKDILGIEKRSQELIETRQQAEKNLWEQEGVKGTFVAKTQTIADLPVNMQIELITSDNITNKIKEKATDDLLKSLLNKYQDYNTKRIEVEKQFQKDLNELQKLPESKEKDAAISQLKKEHKAAIKSINKEESAELVKTSDLFVRLFTDASQQTVRQIRKVIDETQELYNYLKNTKDEDITDNFGFTAEQLRTFKGDAEQLKAILDGLIAKKKQLAGKSEFQAFAQSIEDAIKKIEKGGIENIGSGISDIGSAIDQFAPQIKKLGEDLGTIFGDEKLAEDIGLATDALSGLATTGAGVGQIISGDILGGIQSVVSGVASLVGVFGKLKNRKKEKEIKRLQEQVELLEKAYRKLGRAIDKAYSKDASELIGQQNEALEKQKVLIQQQIKAEKDKKKTDKGRIKEWELQIEEINLLIEENKEKAIDAIFGQDIKSAIDEFADAYVEAWSAGENRAKASKDFVKKMIKQMVVEAMKADISEPMEKIREKLEQFWQDGFISANEEDIINHMVEQLDKELSDKYSWADKYLEDSKNGTSQQASRGGFETMSQDVGQSLDGRFAASQMSLISIDGGIKILVAVESEALQHIRSFGVVFQEMRNLGLRYISHLENIEKYTKHLPAMASDIAQVKQNTSNI